MAHQYVLCLEILTPFSIYVNTIAVPHISQILHIDSSRRFREDSGKKRSSRKDNIIEINTHYI
jgi:hypothetical protein